MLNIFSIYDTQATINRIQTIHGCTEDVLETYFFNIHMCIYLVIYLLANLASHDTYDKY